MATTVSLTLGSAAAAFSFTSNVAADDTVVIGDVTYTFKASPSAANEVDVGGDLDTSINNLVAAINDSGTEGTTYGTGTVANPYFSATADTTNDEIDLEARFAGSWCNGIYLAATSPGANDISAGGTTFAAISGGTDGAGLVHTHIDDILDLNQVNSEVQYELKQSTPTPRGSSSRSGRMSRRSWNGTLRSGTRWATTSRSKARRSTSSRPYRSR